VEEKGVVKSIARDVKAPVKPGDVVIEVDPRYFRPTEVDFLQADITKAKTELRWEPKITFEELVMVMVDYDMEHYCLSSKEEGKKLLVKKGIDWTKNKLTIG
jgi:GDPmannose 4,6-dehydratase